MLVVSRGRRQSIVVGNDITIEVIGIRGGRVRLGINAPRDVTVYREEVYKTNLLDSNQDPPQQVSDQ